MDLELSEVFVCTACRPAQGLVVLVDEMDARRVVRGSLGCPECGRRVPIRRGVVRFDELEEAEEGSADGEAARTPSARADASGDEARAPAGQDDPGGSSLSERVGGDPGTVTAALLGVADLDGPFLLGPGLDPFAGRVADLSGGAEVLVLAEEAGSGEVAEGRRSTRVVGVDPGDLPLLSRRMGGVALLGPDPTELEEAARVLRSGGRLAVLLPRQDPSPLLEDRGLETVASDRRAWAGARPG